MSGKVFIVTGANAGIGFEVTKILCEAGHDVIMACRSEEKTTKAIEKIKKKFPNALATYMNIDLASMESVRKFVEDFQATGKKLNVLVNNAGLGLNFKDTKRQYTKDNFEITMGTNHLGHFLLTNLLLDDLKKTGGGEDGEARVVVVASAIHDPDSNKKWMRNVQPLDMEDLFLYKENSYNGLQGYKNSKAANIMFTYELSKKLTDSNVTVNAICPGSVPTTELMRSASKATKFFSRYVLRFMKMSKTIHQAATSIVTLASDEKYKGVSGKFIKDDQETKSSEETMDEAKQQELWKLSGGYCKLEGFEPLEAPEIPVEKPVEEKKVEEAEKKGEEGKVACPEAVVPMLNGVNQTVEEVTTDVKEVTGDVVEGVKKEAGDGVEELKKAAVEVKNEVAEKIETEVSEVTKKGGEVVEKIENSIKDTAKDALDSITTTTTVQETPVPTEA